MASSIAAYVLEDGSETSNRSRDAIGITEDELVSLARRYSKRIPAGFFVGMAKRESGTINRGGQELYVTNEHDTDFKVKNGKEVEYNSYGIFQMGRGEAIRALKTPMVSTLIDPAENTEIAAVNWESQLSKIEAAAEAAGYRIPNTDVWYYLAWAHNAGVGEPLESIEKYGLDWAAFKSRDQNEYVRTRLVPYAEWITGEVFRLPQTGGSGDEPVIGFDERALVGGTLLALGCVYLYRKYGG